MHDLDQPELTEPLQSLTHRLTVDAGVRGKLPLGRQLRAGWANPVDDLVEQRLEQRIGHTWAVGHKASVPLRKVVRPSLTSGQTTCSFP